MASGARPSSNQRSEHAFKSDGGGVKDQKWIKNNETKKSINNGVGRKIRSQAPASDFVSLN